MTPPELQTGTDFCGGAAAAGRPGAAGAVLAAKPLIYDPAADSLAVVDVDLGGSNCGGAVLLADGRVLLTISYGSGDDGDL